MAGTSHVGTNGHVAANWHELERALRVAMQGDSFWKSYLGDQTAGPRAVHLAVFVEPFLSFLLAGRKTVDSRFSTRRFAPYDQVAPGDVVLVKRASGPVVGICRVANAWFYRLDPGSWRAIRDEFAAALCAEDPAFWARRADASFASLMRLDHVRRIEPIRYAKRDRRPWVVLKPIAEQPALSL